MIENYMQQLQKDLELPKEFDSQMQGVYTMPLEEDLSIVITSLPFGFSFTCKVAPCPKEKEDAFYARMLLANLFGQGTKGAILGLDEDGKMLTVVKTVEYNVDYKDFRDMLEDFINVVDFWRDEVKTHK